MPATGADEPTFGWYATTALNLLIIGREGSVGSKARTGLLKQEDDLPGMADDFISIVRIWKT